MKIALVTTTINVPRVLKLYRACSSDVKFFIAHDEKSSFEAEEFGRDLPNCLSLTIADQKVRNYTCSDLLGFNTIGRRSIAILEALKWGAEIIVTVDDDNIPMSTDYFDRFEMVLDAPFSGCAVEPATFFNVGSLCAPSFVQRGFPCGALPNCFDVKPIVDAKVGVACGVAFGDPDLSAAERMVKGTYTAEASELLRAGVVFQPKWKQWTVFNSQVTAFTRELAPCFLMAPPLKRYDDIVASLVAQRVMRGLDLCVHFGFPFVFQQRNKHDLVRDLEAEIWGERWIGRVAEELDDWPVDSSLPVTKQVGIIYSMLVGHDWFPGSFALAELVQAWIDDCEKVMA